MTCAEGTTMRIVRSRSMSCSASAVAFCVRIASSVSHARSPRYSVTVNPRRANAAWASKACSRRVSSRAAYCSQAAGGSSNCSARKAMSSAGGKASAVSAWPGKCKYADGQSHAQIRRHRGQHGRREIPRGAIDALPQRGALILSDCRFLRAIAGKILPSEGRMKP